MIWSPNLSEFPRCNVHVEHRIEAWGWSRTVLKNQQLEVRTWIGLTGGGCKKLVNSPWTTTAITLRYGCIQWKHETTGTVRVHPPTVLLLGPGEVLPEVTFLDDCLLHFTSWPQHLALNMALDAMAVTTTGDRRANQFSILQIGADGKHIYPRVQDNMLYRQWAFEAV